MSLLASIGLIVSSPIIGEVVILPKLDTPSPFEDCEETSEILMHDGDSSIIRGAEDSVIRNLAPSACASGRTIYETNLVHRDPSNARIYHVEIIPFEGNSRPENE